MIVKALLCAIICVIGESDASMQLWFLSRPIVMGPLTGLVLGDVQTGLLVGVAVETMFLAEVHVGTAFPPDACISSVIATAFAVAAGGNSAVAIAAALPISAIGQIGFYVNMSVLGTFCAVRYEKAAETGDLKGMRLWHVIMPLVFNCILYGVPTFLAVYVSDAAVQAIIDAIPVKLIAGIGTGAGMLAAVGLAMLLKSVNGKGLWPYLLLGYFLSAYLGVGSIGVAIVAAIVVGIMFYQEKNKYVAVTEAEDKVQYIADDED